MIHREGPLQFEKCVTLKAITPPVLGLKVLFHERTANARGGFFAVCTLALIP